MSLVGEKFGLERCEADSSILWIIKQKVHSTRSEFLFWSGKNNSSNDLKNLT